MIVTAQTPDIGSIYIELICIDFTKSAFNLNKRPMGHKAHRRKLFKSINTYDYRNVA